MWAQKFDDGDNVEKIVYEQNDGKIVITLVYNNEIQGKIQKLTEVIV